MYLDQQHDDVLIEIIDYLDGKDILVMLLVSKRINQVISRSSELMGKIKLVFDFNKIQKSHSTPSAKSAKLMDPHDLFQTNRNYQAVYFKIMDDATPEELMQILKKFQNIQSLTWCCGRFFVSNLSCFRSILLNWKTTLKEINLKNVYCNLEIKDKNLEPLEFNHLKKLSVLSASPKILEIFTNSTLNSLNYDSCYYNSEEPNSFINFLNLQANLKFLRMAESNRIFLTADFSTVSFQLDSMECSSYYWEDTSLIKYLNFLKSQAKSLISLTQSGNFPESIFRIILNNMPKLKKFVLFYTHPLQNEFNFNSFSFNYSIEICEIRMVIHYHNVQNVIKLMKNLQTLKLKEGNVEYLFEADLIFLRCLSLEDCIAVESDLNEETGAFPSLKELELKKVSWELSRHLIMKNPQLTNLKITKELEEQVQNLISTESLNNLKVQVVP